MKKKIPLFSILVLTIFFGCNNNKETRTRDFGRLLSKFEPISFDTLKIFYGFRGEQNSRFKGNALDSNDLSLLPVSLRPKEGALWSDRYFACFKFPVDSARTALITRTPWIYESSSLSLMVYDKNADSILYQFEVGQDWADVSGSFTKTSWLYKDNLEHRVFTIAEDQEGDPRDKDSVKIKTDSYLLRFAGSGADTLVKNDTLLAAEFKAKS
jgi:hypothetical protein